MVSNLEQCSFSQCIGIRYSHKQWLWFGKRWITYRLEKRNREELTSSTSRSFSDSTETKHARPLVVALSMTKEELVWILNGALYSKKANKKSQGHWHGGTVTVSRGGSLSDCRKHDTSWCHCSLSVRIWWTDENGEVRRGGRKRGAQQLNLERRKCGVLFRAEKERLESSLLQYIVIELLKESVAYTTNILGFIRAQHVWVHCLWLTRTSQIWK